VGSGQSPLNFRDYDSGNMRAVGVGTFGGQPRHLPAFKLLTGPGENQWLLPAGAVVISAGGDAGTSGTIAWDKPIPDPRQTQPGNSDQPRRAVDRDAGQGMQESAIVTRRTRAPRTMPRPR
jgi:hypothetical protein